MSSNRQYTDEFKCEAVKPVGERDILEKAAAYFAKG